MTDQNYLTIGELARRVGVTVRTIQYYDQQGLLSPSAKGPQNQRLYTDDNVKDLYRILTLKYLGLSLDPDQIRCSSLPRAGSIAGVGRRADGCYRRAVPIAVQAHDHAALPA